MKAIAISALETFSKVRISKVYISVILIYLAIYFLDRSQVIPTFYFAVDALLQTAPFILFATLMIGFLSATDANTIVSKFLGGQGVGTIIIAALIGGLMPFCSCEVIPFVAALLAAGVPVAVVMSFWLSSPLMDPAALIITASALGWNFAIAKTIAAVAIGILGGLAIATMSKFVPALIDNPLKSNFSLGCNCASPSTSTAPVWAFWKEAKRRKIFTEQTLSNSMFLFKWLALAYSFEAVMVQYLPADLVVTWVGGTGIGSIFLGALVGAPAYLNGYAAPAIASGFINQGMNIGAAMSFLIAGGVTSIPAMMAVFALTRLRIFIAYISLGFTGAVFSGVVYSAFYSIAL